MANPAYRKGVNFEYRVKKDLEKSGHTVIRSAGSHSIADLVAFSEKMIGMPLFVQCKLHGAMTKKEMADFYNSCSKIGVQAILAQNIKGKINYQKITYIPTPKEKTEN